MIISWAKGKVTEVKEKTEGQGEKGSKEKQAHTSDIQKLSADEESKSQREQLERAPGLNQLNVKGSK